MTDLRRLRKQEKPRWRVRGLCEYWNTGSNQKTLGWMAKCSSILSGCDD